MTGTISALRLGSAARFTDRWRGTITALEITEDWEVVNVVVEAGLLIWRSSIRLPLSAATEWSGDHVAFSCTSTQAFAHEVPPVAVPSRPVAADTPLSQPGSRFAGALVDHSDRKVIELLLRRGVSWMGRIKVTEVSFEGKMLKLAVQPYAIPRYRSDAEIAAEIHRVIREAPGLTGDDKRGLHFSVSGGIVTMTGNTRVPRAREYAAALAQAIAGVVAVRDESIDDLALETHIGMAIEKSGVGRHSQVYARASLGEVLLYGYVPSPAAAEDVIRAVGAVPGVREVKSRLEVRAAA
ncbi:MAG: BON domain-containing protein [Dehalococcoidia bacterium]